MDNLKQQNDLKALESLGVHMENKLKFVGFELSDLPDDVLVLLEKYVDIQAHGSINELNINYLREFYFCKKRKCIENKLTITQQLAKLKNLKNAMQESEMDIVALKGFMSSVNKRSISAAAQQHNIDQIDGKSKSLQSRQKAFKVPDDFNIESVIEKINLLEINKAS